MSHFEQFIGIIKEDIGIFDQEKFFQHLISQGLSCSFDEFNKMINQTEKPSPNFIDTLLAMSDNDKKETLIKIYGELMFPKNYQVSAAAQGVKFIRQKISAELTEFQINEIAKSKIHYYLFLILVLKADKLKATILKKQFGNLDTIDVVIDDLVNAQVLIKHNGYLYSVSPNVKFPPANTDKIKKFYQQFDDWDKSFPTTFNFEKLIEKTIIRRISARHVPVIQKQLENALDTIRTSEMSLLMRDEEPIIFLQMNLSKGK